MRRALRRRYGRTKNGGSKALIRKQMRSLLDRHIDRHNEVDATGLTEDWDREFSDGGSTLDSDHEAWEVAVDLALEHEARRR